MDDIYKSRTYPYVYRGIITDNNDPDKIGRVRMTVPELFGNEIITDWAYPRGSDYGGLTDNGNFKVPEIGSGVYVEFESGDPDRPLYGGSWWALSDTNEIPKLAKEEADETTNPPKGIDVTIGAIPGVPILQEPPSPYAAKYPNNKVMKSSSGHVIEIDDTPGAERLHVWHRTGTFIEIHPSGKVVINTQDDVHQIINGDYNLHVKGNMNVVVDQTRNIKCTTEEKEITGNRFRTTHGNETLNTLLNRTYVVAQNETLTVLQNRTRGVAIAETVAIGQNKVELVGINNTVMVLGKHDHIVLVDRFEFTGINRRVQVLLNNIERTEVLHVDSAGKFNVLIGEQGTIIG